MPAHGTIKCGTNSEPFQALESSNTLQLEHERSALQRELSAAKRRAELSDEAARGADARAGVSLAEADSLRRELRALSSEYRSGEQEASWLRNGMREREGDMHRLSAELDAAK